MSYDVKCLELAQSFGEDAKLMDHEIARLAQHIQDEIEEEIKCILYYRKVKP